VSGSTVDAVEDACQLIARRGLFQRSLLTVGVLHARLEVARLPLVALPLGPLLELGEELRARYKRVRVARVELAVCQLLPAQLAAVEPPLVQPDLDDALLGALVDEAAERPRIGVPGDLFEVRGVARADRAPASA
jgi:hypothetical protein